MANELVPFGKYKGQPLEVLLGDAQYMAWLSGQPWVRERFPVVQTLIINNFGEPDETPEHNQLQGLFFEDSFAQKFWRHVFMTETKKEMLQDAIKEMNRRLESGISKIGDDDIPDLMAYTQGLIDGSFPAAIEDVESEVYGWDIHFDTEVPFYDRKYIYKEHWVDVFVEIKPQIGDDYPAILRQMKNNRNRIDDALKHDKYLFCDRRFYLLFYRDYTGKGVSEAVMRQQFDSSFIKPVRMLEI